MFGISPMQLIIILVIVVLLFGTKKLRNMGGDLGSAVKGFKKAVSDDDKDADFKADDKVEDNSKNNEQTVQQNVKSESDTKTKSE
ncbi:twin-arginine translocase TatA/TatE family subunit [Paraglaciecola chathamensis]|jgi:sec-independent protein translocase protein TatA|uniref:Sec-independent protein translocase protein TatA n=3 Tax=Paraglaciecola chathamensis TaxID=368405 RepID=A0A8H9M1R3_9ALTE|nr:MULTISPECIES: twin-arginine translocase TatA/TatE family subunit [Paraglaciecola]MBN27465.1 twin-arginine translocase TatA/TatE family subunit [Alteromonadaceae bacterium]MBJ2136429.1 twin-arginine translocase TatA/TatE family subunit [Paraglaciecola chathamensis]MBU3017846.1 twin-arginine translocase TatA/TatE family subunit [Paraglaciecola agarilytica]MDO6558805.1 twin-arginine translocase TatA/TatE family subunit [Paraglaciecola chathamensis]MDO6839567.1 twin-arginine translocase TatA/Ta|tara:strand:- start:15195 stop:15449 length:255 start_codon:yes stop_codon:yes gene_type:complete